MTTHGFFSPHSTAPIIAGVGLVLAGVGLIVLTWFRIAELVLVPAQFPLLVSGGLTGMVLVLVGLTLVNVHVKRMESAKRIAAITELTDAVRAGGAALAVAPSPAVAAETAELPALEPAADDAPWAPSSPTAEPPVSRSVWT